MVMQAMKGPVLLPAPRNLVWKGEGVQADSWCCHQGERVPEHLVRTWCQVVGTTTHMVAREAEANLRLSLDPAGSCGQAYRLTVSASGVDLQAGGPAGLFYGLMTLKQLQDPASNVVPGCVIEDGPDFTVRGVMLDVSRCKVPTLNTLFGWIDNLACWKLNQLQLYMEHTFAYTGHDRVWEKASPYTADDLHQLDAYCRDRFIELVPNQNSFGHLHRWLQHPTYQHLAEHLGTYTTSWGEQRRGPFSLDATSAESLTFLEGLYDELLPCFGSRQVNVGCDETFDLGCGKSRERCNEVGKGRVYLEFLLKLHGVVQARGYRMQFWGDIVLNYPDLVPELPSDLIPLVWGYEADHPFEESCQRFAESGLQFYVCPGTSSWLSLAGRTENCQANLLAAAEAGHAAGAEGYLITDWGDQGHWQYLPASFAGVVTGAGSAWCLASNREPSLATVLDTHAYRDRQGKMGRLTLELGNLYQRVTPLKANQSQLWRLLKQDGGNVESDGIQLSDLVAAREAIHAVIDQLDETEMACDDADWVLREWRNTCGLMLQGCSRGIGRLRGLQGSHSFRREVSQDLRRLLHEHRELWMARNREGGFAESVAPLEGLLEPGS